jgi:hypothetical protein
MSNDSLTGLGLRPVTTPTGNLKVRYYVANTAQAIYRFQPVALNNSGQVEVAGLGANTKNIGVAVGFTDSSRASLPSGMTTLSAGAYLPAATDAYVAVTDDIQQEYIIEEGTDGTALTSAALGANAAFTYLATTGNTTTGIANVVLSSSSLAASTAGALQLLAVQGGTNLDGTVNAAGAGCKWIVRIFKHQIAPDVGSPV